MGRFTKYLHVIESTNPIKYVGNVKKIIGLTIISAGPQCEIGELCHIRLNSRKKIAAEVVGFYDNDVILMPFEGMEEIYPGCEVVASGQPLSISITDQLKGRIISGIGKPLDGKEEIFSEKRYPLYNQSPNPIKRARIERVLSTGIKAIDSFLTIGKGQRVGIFSGAGVGKSVLLGMIAKNVRSDVNVIALIGERGREVREFIEKDLGEEGLKNSVIVAATADAPPLVRIKGAFLATTIAEWYREQGKDVVLMMDSITRFARAQRELGLAAGEPPATRGFPPSVFTQMASLIERTGSSEHGTITAFYNVLVEADDFNEPIADTAKGHLDGHIDLSRALANKGQYPAIDITSSISRLMTDLVSSRWRNLAMKAKEIVATYKEAEDLINIGAYVKGSNPKIDYAVKMIDPLNQFIRQEIAKGYHIEETGKLLFELFNEQAFVPAEDMRNYYSE